MSVTLNGVFYTDEQWEQRISDRLGPRGDKIPVDEQAVLALIRVSTGADVHDTNALIGSYKSCCYEGRQLGADKFKRAMYERAIKLQKLSGK